MIDLHSHTLYSDGDLNPEQLLQKASSVGVKVLSITDHDTLAAYHEEKVNVVERARQFGIDLIPGIELSSLDTQTGEKIHVLGLGVDVGSPTLNALCNEMKQSRIESVENAANKLEALGFSLDINDLTILNTTITKLHVGRAVVRDVRNRKILTSIYGKVPLYGAFIEDYLISGKPAEMKKGRELHTIDAVEAVHIAGGVAICAHPSFNILKGLSLSAMGELIVRNKFDGIEAVNIQYDKSNGDERFDMIDTFRDLALDNDLLVSGGSDYHGDNIETWGMHTSIGFSNETDYRMSLREIEKLKKAINF